MAVSGCFMTGINVITCSLGILLVTCPRPRRKTSLAHVVVRKKAVPP
jgi:hypothetical protein